MPRRPESPAPQHAAAPAPPAWRTAAMATLATLLVAAAAGVVGAVGASGNGDPQAGHADRAMSSAIPPAATALPVPEFEGATPATPATPVTPAAPSAAALCDQPAVQTALAALDDASVIAAAGGGEGFRQEVIAGSAPCISLRDPRHAWFVVNKTLPMDPIDYGPTDIVQPAGVRNGPNAYVRADVAASVTALAEAANAAGAGQLGVQNAYRGYSIQVRIHGEKVAALGKVAGENLAARPGHSEHQSGIAMDVMSCASGCGSSEAFGGTPLSAWVIEHGWEYGWIVRYEPGATPITGYDAEAWHLRYIGPELAAAYHEGGFHTLEEFFALPPAPAYLD